MALVLTRSINQSVCIGGAINVYLSKIISDKKAKLAIDAPSSVDIGRDELDGFNPWSAKLPEAEKALNDIDRSMRVLAQTCPQYTWSYQVEHSPAQVTVTVYRSGKIWASHTGLSTFDSLSVVLRQLQRMQTGYESNHFHQDQRYL